MPISEPLTVSESLLSIDTLVAMGAIDTGSAVSIVYTFKAVTNALKWTVFGANLADFSDEAIVQAEATVNAGAVGNYSTNQAMYRYYRVKQKASVGGAQGTGTVTAVAKG